jgi:hypothetical protein
MAIAGGSARAQIQFNGAAPDDGIFVDVIRLDAFKSTWMYGIAPAVYNGGQVLATIKMTSMTGSVPTVYKMRFGMHFAADGQLGYPGADYSTFMQMQNITIDAFQEITNWQINVVPYLNGAVAAGPNQAFGIRIWNDGAASGSYDPLDILGLKLEFPG